MKFVNKRKNLIRVICLLAVIGIGAGGIYLMFKSENRFQLSEEAQDGPYKLPEIAYQERLEEMEPSYFRMQINASPTVDFQSGKGNLMIGNPEENKENVTVSLFIDETGEKIFESDMIKPGERTPYAVLDTIPKPGEYKVTAVFSMISESSTEVIGEVEAGLTMTVE